MSIRAAAWLVVVFLARFIATQSTAGVAVFVWVDYVTFVLFAIGSVMFYVDGKRNVDRRESNG